MKIHFIILCLFFTACIGSNQSQRGTKANTTPSSLFTTPTTNTQTTTPPPATNTGNNTNNNNSNNNTNNNNSNGNNSNNTNTPDASGFVNCDFTTLPPYFQSEIGQVSFCMHPTIQTRYRVKIYQSHSFPQICFIPLYKENLSFIALGGARCFSNEAGDVIEDIFQVQNTTTGALPLNGILVLLNSSAQITQINGAVVQISLIDLFFNCMSEQQLNGTNCSVVTNLCPNCQLFNRLGSFLNVRVR